MKNFCKYFLCNLSIFIFVFSFHSLAFAETNIYGGTIIADTTWTKDDGPYIIYAPDEGDLFFTVDVGATLTIEAGTVIKFDYGQFFTVLGDVVVNGSADEKVYFTSIDDDSVGGDTCLDENLVEPYNTDWSGIEIIDGGNIELKNSVISYAETGLYVESATSSLDNVNIINCEDGLSLYESVVSVRNSNVRDLIGDGINVVNNSTADIENINIENISGDALFLYSNSTSSIKSSTINNIEGETFGIYYNSFLNFEESNIQDVVGRILYMFTNSSADIKNSDIENSGDGILFYNNSFLNIFDSYINNVSGDSFLLFYNGSHLNFYDSILQNISGIAIEAYGFNGIYSTTTLDVSSSTISFGNNIGLQIYGNKMKADIVNTKILNFTGDGVQTFSYPNILITDSEISFNDDGIVSWGSNVEIKNSTISDNQNYGISNNPAPNFPEIIATNNWWGDASGPHNIDVNASGTANQVTSNIAIQPWLNSKPGEMLECCSNVMFIPGLEASRLYKMDGDINEERLWEPEVFHDNSLLYLSPDGQPNTADIYTRDIIDNAYLPIKGNIYSSFISSMDSMKADGLINDWKSVPYDWRLSLEDLLNGGKEYPDGKIYYSGVLGSTSDPYIISELRRLASSSATGKVTIVAHSNGGLITKELTNKLGAEATSLIDQIIFVAVPQAGTPAAIGALLHGFQQGLPKDWLPLFISPSESRELGKNMSSAYNLLPFSQYFNYVSDPVMTFDNSDLLSGWREKYGSVINTGTSLYNFLSDQLREILPTDNDLISVPLLNINLLDFSKELHDTKLDNWSVPDGIHLTEIAGWGEDTLSGIEYYEGRMTSCTDMEDIYTCDDVPTLEYKPIITYDGDGTVVVPSALWTASSTSVSKYWVDLNDYDTFATLQRKHADILEIPELRSFIESIIIQSSSTLPEYISTSTPINDNLEKHLHFILHSPLSLNLYDEYGNHTGISTTTNELEENIPNSRYITFGEVKYISVPASSTVSLSMQGYSSGSFTLNIEEALGNIIIASTTFAGIPSSTSTIATINILNGNIADSSNLTVDINGDGSQDIILSPNINNIVMPDFSREQIVSSRRRNNFVVSTSSELLIKESNIATTTEVLVTSKLISKNVGLSFERSGATPVVEQSSLQGMAEKGESLVFVNSSKTINSAVFVDVAKQSRPKNIKNGGLSSRSEAGRGESSVINQSLLASVGNIPFGDNIVQQFVSFSISFIKNTIKKISLWYNY